MKEQELIIAKQHFHEDMLKIFRRTAKEIKYKPTRRLDLINKYGGYEAAIKILPTDSNTFDFTLLWEQERLDLSIEALVTKERYVHLFPEEIAAFCQKRLDEYNYAPKKLEVSPDAIDALFESLIGEVETEQKMQEETFEDMKADGLKTISQEQWEDVFLKQTVFTTSHKELMLGMYALGNQAITLETLASLNGYSKTYPFFDVIVTLCKRIKNTLKLETPIDKNNNVVWWAILFKGEVVDKKTFRWQLRDELVNAIKSLIEKGNLPATDRVIQINNPLEEIPSSMPEEKQEDVKSDCTEQVEEEVLPVIKDTTVKEEIIESSIETSAKQVIAEKVIPEEVIAEKIMEMEERLPSKEIASSSQEDSKNNPLKRLEELNQNDYNRLKKECLSYHGSACELCGFDFGYTYGETFDDFIDIHCIDSIKLNTPESINPEEDLIPICTNCKSVMYHKTPAYTLEEMKGLIEGNK